ncbi:TonB-dependent receptor [Sphingomonas sp. BK235]|uniref:TonB-dependent receptor n=1 Tax=Sphingomonas sp. BK235 TaxID=2512131 RepID=UPI0010459CB6|nr:TonB-dependent receptor [Sphingomonas sp. BK235]TCP34286.1 carboxypeptidase family protein [Sphingomonas sp. BK235]
MRNNLLVGAALVALVAPATAMAQETTSTIRGTVTAQGAPVAGATVTITHVPSNTRTTTATSADGSFQQNGLRVGGPFTVEVTSPQGNTTVTDISTIAQQTFELPIDLAGDVTGGDIVVTASSIQGAGTISSGLRTVLTQEDIRKVASVNRDIRDIERRDPLATLDLTNSRAVSFGGVNPRFNRFTINGVQVGDNFGLNSDANPTGRGPVPFDAISQVSVAVAPTDIRQGNFQGGAIDTVLASGSNEFHGTGFYSESRDEWQGKRIKDQRVALPDYNSKTYGAMLSGPLIADKLFFMVAAERNTDPRPLSTTSISQIPNATQAQIDQISAIARDTYGYEPGGFLTVNSQKDEKIVGRIDWNVTDGHRLSLSYINAYESSTVAQGTSTNANTPAVGLESNYYQRSVLLRAGIAQLNSEWTDNLSTEARFLYKSNRVGQDPLFGANSPQYTVCTAPTSVVSGTNTTTSCGTGAPTVIFGPDISRQANQLFFDTWGGSLQATYTAGAHTVKMLAEVNANRTFNYFLQRATGAYYFDSIADFQNRSASQFDYANAVSLNTIDVAADFKYQQYTFGLQDEWDITDRLTLTYGARYDLYAMRTPVPRSDAFFGRYGFYNTKTYKGLDNFQPRITALWKPITDLNIRATAAVYGGGSPDIYLSNSYSNTGVLSNRVTITRATAAAGAVAGAQNTATCTAPYTGANAGVCTDALNGVSANAVPGSVNSFLASNTASLANAPTAALAPDFKLPSVTKLTASADYTLYGFRFGATYLYTKTNQAVTFTDLRSRVIGTLPDGRPRYASVTGAAATDTNQDILLGNTSKGRSHIFVLNFDKRTDWGLSFGGSYTWQDVKDVSPASSSTATSNYFNVAMYDPNNATLGISADQTKWAFKYNLGFDHAFFGDYKTTFQLFGETRAGRPFSYTMQSAGSGRSAVFGTVGGQNLGTNSDQRYLLYVPTSTTDPLVSYDSQDTATALDGLINGSKLKDYRGKVAARNIARNRAFTRIDLHLEQELPTFIGGSRVSIFGDIENLPNLLNSDWGGLTQLGFPQYAAVVQVQCLSAAGAVATASTQPCAQYRYSSYRAPNPTLSVNNSLYLIRVGARFRF